MVNSVNNGVTDTQFAVTMRCGTTYTLDALERAGISYLPCTYKQPIVNYKHLWGKRQQVTLKRLFPKNPAWALKGMTGVQLITGEPTHRRSPTSPNGYIFLTDIDIESALLKRYPEIAEKVIALYSDAVEGQPCIIETKSEGRRLSAFCAYLYPKREFHDKTDGKMLVEFFSLKGLSRIDDRYAMLQGSLLQIPTLEKRVLQEIYQILSEVSATKEQVSDRDTRVVERSQLGDIAIDWDADGKSPYFLSEYCQATEHRSNRRTVQFSKWAGGVQGHCFNCGESWWETPPKEPQRRSTLKMTGEYNETLVSLAENEEAILNAFAQALTEDTEAETPHYHILHFEMGSGKNHAFLTTLATLKKRGIGIFENHEQVDEQVYKGINDFGLRAMGFRGRGYKFDESGLSALPVNMRTQQHDLFEKYRVVCGFYDQIFKWEGKGLGAYEYCLGCPFLKTCPYLAQFQIAADMDFLAICMHDLFFDPGLAAFFQRIYRRGEETEEEQLIGAALGVETQTSTEYDIGVVDEVVARNLYLSNEYAFSDFEALANAWEGEALGDFFTEILNCLRQTTDDPDPLSAVKAYLQTLDDDTQQLINQQMTQIPKEVSVHEHTQRHADTHEVLSEYYVVDNAENQWRIPVSPDAEKILRKKKVPTLAYQKHLPRGKIGVSPYAELRRGTLRLSEIQGRLWSTDWTFLDQIDKAIKLDIQWIGTKYNAKGEPVCCDTLTLTIPPQVNPILKRIVLMGGTLDVENIRAAFTGQRVKFTVSEGKTAEYKPGVQTYQYIGGRVTHQSVFEYEKDADGKTIYDAETNSPKVIGIKPTALKDLQHTCTLAERHIAEGNEIPVFISYKDFTDPPIADLPIVQRMHECLQVKHFDLTRGINFEGVKVFLVYGYPKSARPDVVKQTAEILHHADEKPLDFTYQRSNEKTDGYEAYQIGKYQDPRVEAVRQQLTRDKSKQALYRPRPTRWENTITLNVSAEPIPGWTERATGFTRPDFYRAQRFEDIGAMIAERTELTAENTIEDFQRVYNCSYERARQLWIQAGGQEHKADTDNELRQRILEMKDKKIGERKIATRLGISYGRLRTLLKKH